MKGTNGCGDLIFSVCTSGGVFYHIIFLYNTHIAWAFNTKHSIFFVSFLILLLSSLAYIFQNVPYLFIVPPTHLLYMKTRLASVSAVNISFHKLRRRVPDKKLCRIHPPFFKYLHCIRLCGIVREKQLGIITPSKKLPNLLITFFQI